MSLEHDVSTTAPADDQDVRPPDELGAIYAESMSNTLLPLLQATDLPLTCLSRHDHACNFRAPNGAIIALVTPRHGNGPFHIVLPHPLPPQLTNHNDAHAHWRQGIISIGTLRIALHRATLWQPDLPVLHSVAFDALLSLHEISHQYRPSSLLDKSTILGERVQQGIKTLQMGFAQKDGDKIRSGVLYLAGLGPGLTPAGDDFLVGLLAALTVCRLQISEEQRELSQLIGQMAAAQTTQLSGQWLYCAGQGHFGEAWHNLNTALNSNNSAAVTAAANRILTTGATSGVDAMSGFLFGIRLFKDKETRD